MIDININPIYEKIIDELGNNKFSISNHFFTSEETAAFKTHVINQDTSQDFHAAAIGNAHNEKIIQSIRGDKIRWIDENNKYEVEEIFFQKVNDFIQYLNRTCYMGIEESEFHYALYPEGTFYQRHIDAFKNDDRRTLSMVFYLNDEDWKEEYGGQLSLYLPQANGTEKEINILPVAGRLAIFDSKTIPHEVKPVQKPRYSITGWLKTRSISGF
ncbi:2OG-Fe(II) oxygenase [Faecalibacter rhinopitheci]|uniref:2OG-Fe(II) oxygenase n=1 Tax=Faecalibacter rhinopitheci TaxID=2779678 RepID=A0A8J7FN83_9FLAO|nr:2OG-Fe(II) oxygenase [Faecalibacter rhinopitheci]MBF0596144.1 2OG-Fe(II) oxygenase [Faecalibacter rhinopitheci]